MQKRHLNRIQYYEEQEYTTGKYVIPFINEFCQVNPEMNILEIGCGEGGNLKPFLDLGCRVTGVDFAGNKIDLARSLFSNHPYYENLSLICDDIYNVPIPESKFDLVFMRDVIEHIHDQKKFMSFVRPFLKENGIFFLAFPPWQNPFGGHQQVCRNRVLSKLPYFHLLPVRIYRFLLRSGGESNPAIGGLLEIKETGLTIERFQRILKNSGYRILLKRFFLVNPNYEVKFHLKPVRQCSLISGLPGIRNFFTTSVFYLVSSETSGSETR
jgi:SAM-dependent methyltransferase